MNCPFCQIDNILKENDLAKAFFDKFPVGHGHVLVIPKRHVSNFFDITHEERTAIFELVDDCKQIIDKDFNPDGYNIGINCGESAGQTIFHAHVHLIPRYVGDIDNPRGGVRGVIPEKRIY